MNPMRSPYADNYERIKQRNLQRDERGTIERADPRYTHQENLDPDTQAVVDDMRLTPDERETRVEELRRSFVRRHNAACGPDLTKEVDADALRQALDSAPEGREDGDR